MLLEYMIRSVRVRCEPGQEFSLTAATPHIPGSAVHVLSVSRLSTEWVEVLFEYVRPLDEEEGGAV